jgi:hypothetical protein
MLSMPSVAALALRGTSGRADKCLGESPHGVRFSVVGGVHRPASYKRMTTAMPGNSTGVPTHTRRYHSLLTAGLGLKRPVTATEEGNSR